MAQPHGEIVNNSYREQSGGLTVVSSNWRKAWQRDRIRHRTLSLAR
jgi:hypothetical protein